MPYSPARHLRHGAARWIGKTSMKVPVPFRVPLLVKVLLLVSVPFRVRVLLAFTVTVPPLVRVPSTQHVKSAGSQRLVLQLGNLLTDGGGTRIPVPRAHIVDVGDFLADTHIGIAAELDVRAAARHVGRDRDRARHTSLRDDIGFLLVVARVQDREDLRVLSERSSPE